VSGVATQAYAQSTHDKCDASIFPEGWVQATIGGVVDLNPPKPPKDALPPDASVTFVSMPAVDAYSGTITVPEDRPFAAVRKGYTSFRENDVIFAKITPCMENGKSAIARGLTTGLGFGSTEFHVLRSTGAVIPEYVFYYIRQESFRKKAEEEMTGSVGQRRVPVEFLRNALIPLPPLAEQKRIMAKVEQLLTRVNAARECLAKVPEILKRFRQSVLAAACSGRLTADWREKQTNVRPVKEVLGRIQRTRLEQATTPAQKKKLEDIYSYQEREDSKLLPETWGYIALDKLCESFQYGTSKKSQPSGEIPVLRMGNIQNGEIDWSDLVYTSDSTEIQKYELDPGDVLFNRTNSPELVGKTAIYRGKQPAIFAGYLIRINNLEELDSRYLNCCLNSIYGREFCLKAKTDGVSQSNINAQKLGKFEVPFCCEEEQQEIVRRVEALFRLADTIEKRVAVATTHAEKLTQAILAKAFRGELVHTEAELARLEGRSYEPGSVLLAKIEAQRKNVKLQRKRGRSWQRRNK